MTHEPESFSVYVDASKYPQILDQTCRDLIERVIDDRLVRRQRVTVSCRATVWRFQAPTTPVLRENPILLESFLDHLRLLIAGVLDEYAKMTESGAVA